MTDYTPTTEEIRGHWEEMWSYDHSENGKEQRNAQFDRWLESVKAEAVREVEEQFDFNLRNLGY